MTKVLFTVLLFLLLVTEAGASDNNAVVAFARKNANRYKNELIETSGIAVGSTVTLERNLDFLWVYPLDNRYDAETGEMVLGPSSAFSLTIMFQRSCKPLGKVLGQNAYGARKEISVESCEYFWAENASEMAVEITESRIRMAPAQFRAIENGGARIEVDLRLGSSGKQFVVEFGQGVTAATNASPVESRNKVWKVFGEIQEMRLVFPKGTVTVLFKSSNRTSGSVSFRSRVAAKVRPNIMFTGDPIGNPTAEVEIRAAPDGTIVSRKLLKSSGSPAWDDAVLKAIDKAEVLPRDIDGSVPPVLEIGFRPRD